MSGFSPDWLTLREAADDRARNADLRRAFLDALPPSPAIIDLGSGTGSTARALGIAGARWTLTDNDPALLAEAGRRVPGALIRQVDLAADLDAVLEPDADAITASALFDLVSEDWIGHLARAAGGRIVYAALTFDGTEAWTPDHPADLDIARAFDAHQRRDKGFGPATGPMGASVLARTLEAQGYTVTLAPAPWRLERHRDAALMDALAEGVAAAAEEAGCDRQAARDWLSARRSATRCTVGHLDLLAVHDRRIS